MKKVTATTTRWTNNLVQTWYLLMAKELQLKNEWMNGECNNKIYIDEGCIMSGVNLNKINCRTFSCLKLTIYVFTHTEFYNVVSRATFIA